MRSRNQSVYTVSQVNAYVRNMFDQDFMLNRIYIRGEVSNCKYHPSGHLYFSLKDDTGTISCVMFASARRGLAFAMKNGDNVIVCGSVSVYERDGRYQVYAKEITLEGAGLLYERFLALKQELEEMGMFAQEYKQPIPSFVQRLGVVTAPTGAAIQDIRNISYRRNPYIQIILCPALVQGEGAAESIVRGIRMLDQLHPDVIIVGRGGGSIEDLWAFNEETVARAIFECRTPVISAVGHETDTTIADFVADLRAPTPSAAAELAVADVRGILEQIGAYKKRMDYAMLHQLGVYKNRLSALEMRWKYASPEYKIREQRQRLLDLEQHLQNTMESSLQDSRHRLELYIQKMKGLSPLEKLNQGFSYVEKDGHAVRGIGDVREDDEVQICVRDGRISARVTEMIPVMRE
ncbi:MAG: exodeoxyribonuclease VII large subunit [Fusicatenibacter sp.]